VNVVPGDQTFHPGGSRVFRTSLGDAVRVTDVDVGPDPVVVTRTAESGKLKALRAAGATLAGNCTSEEMLSGDLGAVNAALQGLTYRAGKGVTGRARLTIIAADTAPELPALHDVDDVVVNVRHARPPNRP